MVKYNDFPSEPLSQPSFLTIGSFDGVHWGHQALIGGMVAAAHAVGCQAGVMTFDPHPVAVLRPDIPLAYLTTAAERAQILAALGVDFVVILPFSRATAATPAAEFVRALVERLHVKALWTGPDFALGRGREGNVERLAELGQEMGFTVHVMAPIDLAGEPVRSSHVRALLREQGAAARVAELLGRPYEVWGEVSGGASRGRRLGFPTANLSIPPDRLLPAYGVYACWAWIEDPGLGSDFTGRQAAVSVGVRPTFDNGHPTVEAYLLDYDGDLYGEKLGLSFVERLRPELKFDSAEALIEQMRQDVEATRRILSDPPCDAVVSREGWEELRHTADWAVRIQGKSLSQLFSRAAAAMYSLQDTDAGHPIERARAIHLTAHSAADLLIAWLNRLLLAQELAGEMYTRFDIHEISETGLNAVAYGYSGSPTHTEVKAVTYYDLDVSQTPEGWSATVTFDV
jgi:riboflavin kinase / FMN adenylyltransferase